MPVDQPLVPSVAVPPRKSFRGRLVLAGLLVLAFVFYLLQPGLLAWWLRQSLSQKARRHAWTLTLGKVEADFFSGQALFRDIQIRDTRSPINQADCAYLRVDFSPWRTLFPSAISPIERITFGKSRVDWEWLPLGRRKNETRNELPMDHFPGQIIGADISANLAWNGTRLSLENADFSFLPNASGQIGIPKMTVSHAPWQRSFTNLEGVTAIKERGLYVGGVKFADNLILERGGLNFNDPEKRKITADLQLSAFGGEWRTDLDVDTRKTPVHLEASAAFWNLSVNQVGHFLGNPDLAEGTIHEGRLTFRGSPADLARANTTLRFNATDFRWHERRWNSLVASGILVNRRIEIPQFDLVQAKNQIQLKGHADLPAKWTQMPTDFQLQVLAQLDDLHSAALLLSPDQKGFAGEAFFAGEVRDQQGRFSGNLKMRAGPLEISGVAIDGVRGDLDLRGSEVSATNLNFSRGTDKASGWATVDLAEPRRYSGEFEVTASNIANYTAILPKAVSDHAVSGGVQLWWSGDGTTGAHSGAFKATLHDFLLARDADAVPVDLVSHGSYSPAGVALNHLSIQRPTVKLDTALLIWQDSVELRDLHVSGGQGSNISGNLTLPLNLLAALNNPSWAALLESKAAAAGQISGKKVRLEEICELAGHRLPMRGALDFVFAAQGPLESLEATAELDGKDLSLSKDRALPDLQAHLSLSGNDLRVWGEINPGASRDNLTFGFQGKAALSPAGLLRGEFFDPQAPLSGNARTERLAAALLQPWLAEARPFSGDIAGALSLGGTSATPEFNADLAFLQTNWQPAWLDFPLQKLTGELVWFDDRLKWNAVAGTYRSGSFIANGVTGLLPEDDLELTIAGKNIDLSSTAAGFTGSADGEVQLRGPQDARFLSGILNLKKAELRREASVVLASPAVRISPKFSLPLLPSDWTIALKLTAEPRLTLRGNLASWSMRPDLELTGSATRPLFRGKLTLYPLIAGTKIEPKGEIPIYFLKTSLENGVVGDLGLIVPFDSTMNPPSLLGSSLPGSSTQHLEIQPLP